MIYINLENNVGIVYSHTISQKGKCEFQICKHLWIPSKHEFTFINFEQ